MSEWESVFGFSDDPTPGDAEVLGQLARSYRSVADNAGDALPLVSGLENQQVGEGKTMEKLRDKLGDLAKQVRKLHSSYDQAAGALDTYVHSLRDQQRNADNALEKGREAKERLASATETVRAAGADIGRLDAATHPPDDEEARASTRRALDEARTSRSTAQGHADDAQADLDAARLLAEDARQVREEDASTAAQKLDDAKDESVAGYSLWDKIKKSLSTAFGIISAVLGVLALLVPGLQGIGLALTIGSVVAGAASFGINMAMSAESGDWNPLDIVLGIVGMVGGGAAALKGIGGIGSALKGVKPASMKNPQGGTRINSRDANSRTCKTDPVDVASGEMMLPQTDLSLPGVLPLVITRTHLSTYRYGQFFGPSWASTLDERLEVDDRGRVLWAREDGSILTYPGLPVAGSDDLVWPEEGPRLPLTHEATGAAGEVTYRITDPHTGLVCAFADHPGHDKSGWYWLTGWQDRNGNEVGVSRLEDGTPTRLVHSGGYRVDVHCLAGRLLRLAVSTPEGPVEVMSYSHDADGNLTHIANSSGESLVFGYDERSRITSWTDRNDSTYRYVYDDDNRVTETIGPEGYLSSRWTYDPDERRTHYTDACGATTVYQLNDLHQVTAETDPLGHTTTSEWDRYDNLLARTDALGNTTRFEYDRAHNPTAIQLPDGSRSTATYNELNLPLTSTGHDGATWRQEYDERGNLTTVIGPDGTTNRFTPHRTGAIASAMDPSGAVVTYEVDDAGLPVAIANSAEHRATIERDAFGRPTTVTDPLGAITRAVWTVEGHLSEHIGPDGRSEHLTWDGEGNCLTRTDPAGATTRYEYTHFDQVAARTTPDGVRHAFAHDAELRRTQVTNPQGLTWDYTYDRAGNLIAESDFDDRRITYEHNALGRIVSHTTPLGQEITYRYNSVGELVAKDAAGAVTSYTYDSAGALVRAASPTSTLELEWDLMGQVVAETVDGRTTRFTYDILGRRTSRTTPTGAVTEFTFDEDGNRDSLITDGHRLDFTYDILGRELARAWGTAASRVTATTAWDIAGRSVAHSLVTPGRTLRERSYTYRADNGLIAVADHATGMRRDMELDPVGRPLTVTGEGWTESYAYDQAGNQTEATWPEKAHRAEARGSRAYTGTRIQAAGAVRYEHDAAGRMVLRQKHRLSERPDTWRYEWDAEDRLTACTSPDGTRWHYGYDPLGRRTAKYRMAEDGQTVVEAVHFTWDGTSLAEQTDTTTGVTLTWEHDGHRPLTQLERRPRTTDGNDSRFFAIVTDLVGAPTELVDEQGDIAWRSRSTVWGATTHARGATALTPFRFPGQYEDRETGLHYNYFRHYDPESGRYTTPDPLGLAPAPNPVAYVDDPQTWSDPLGLAPCNEKDPSWGGKVQYNKLDPRGRPTGVKAKLELGMTGGKTNPRPPSEPPGWQSGKNFNRGHVLGAQIGGSNKAQQNFVTLHRHANAPVMVRYENQIRRAVDAGEKVEYKVTPVYKGKDPMPSHMRLEAKGDNGFQFTHQGGRPPSNSVIFPNKAK
ncbi:DNA/RNA non-specific endonuclease [Streptomyces lydicus]|uniref:DNA/RNA non-specific endonuclease n=1 Tax=Streptomyces lydicus TaxID=47763 RepID=UPI0013E2B922|nr:DNA/RNA non-specific endonuclease [Streptomyces lydicus]